MRGACVNESSGAVVGIASKEHLSFGRSVVGRLQCEGEGARVGRRCERDGGSRVPCSGGKDARKAARPAPRGPE
ncbi:hypothetical protein JYU34_004611 [Plutella xylostella]|uniref:Uncharacterized protein n=1 Tax=Plutella xylostella TaxID=51655 RepID=A0ABQ7QYF2_PLUXY|nr:hypothetical protein JYU34_004611 [Plutella xylostella]